MRLLSGGHEQGVSLAEALIAAAILGFIGVVMVAGLYTTLKGNTIARVNILAEGLARYELEYVKAVSDNWTNLTTNNTPPWSYTLPGGPYPKWDTSHNALPAGYTGYTVTVSGGFISDSPYSSNANIEQITATVTYNAKQEAQISEYVEKY